MEALGRARAQIQSLTGLKTAHVVAFEETEQGFRMQIELVEKESIPHQLDILGRYEVRLFPNGDVQNFRRVALRQRGSTDNE